LDIKSNIIIVPRGKEYVGSTPSGKPGLRWKTRYGLVGMNAFDMPITVDGLNEKGLHVGLFYFPGFAKYQEIKAEDVGKALAPWELGVFLLGTCSDVKQAVAATRDVRVGEVVQKDMGFVPPVHYIVTDAKGKSAVLEPTGGKLKVHDNPLGVMSNSPTFDWHMTNLSNDVNMTVSNVPKIDVGGKEIKSFGQGSGMRGIPGDFTPSFSVRSGGGLLEVGLACVHRQGRGAASLPHPEPIRHPQGSGEGCRAWQGGCRLHALDNRC
jgi:choloylglycine hydrolase